MCGILACVDVEHDPSSLGRALDTMAHRGPEGRGEWSGQGVWLGHRRLKIIDLSDAAAQPMANEDGSALLVFNGEIYNFLELREELEARGHTFRSHSDGEVILHGYEEWGEACVERLWGMFAFAIWDARIRKLLAARDRFGKKPLSYSLQGRGIVLASEIRALLATDLVSRNASRDGLGLFWQLNYIPAPYSAFVQASKLPAGCTMVFEEGDLRVHRYYPPREVAPFRGSFEEACDESRALLRDASRRRLVSDVPLAVTLSGGIDSAVVGAAAREASNSRMVSLTVRPHLEGSRHDEGEQARISADILCTEHHEVRPEPESLESLARVIGSLGEPFAIASAVPSFHLFGALKQHATVVLSGDGGDEIFGGYSWYPRARLQRAARSLGALWRGAYLVTNAAYGFAPPLRTALKAALAALRFAQGLPLSEARWEGQRVLTKDFRAVVDREELVFDYLERIGDLVGRTDAFHGSMLRDQFDWLPYHVLTKVDATSMAHAVEVRSPLLDHRLAEFARSLPVPYLFRDGVGKAVLRRLLAPRWPTEFLRRPKSGFALPIREVLAASGGNWIREALLSPHPVFHGCVRRDALEETIRSHVAGRPFQTGLLIKLFALRSWFDQSGARLS